MSEKNFIPYSRTRFMDFKDLRETLRLLKLAGYKILRNTTEKGRSYEVVNPYENDELVMLANKGDVRYLVKYNKNLYPGTK